MNTKMYTAKPSSFNQRWFFLLQATSLHHLQKSYKFDRCNLIFFGTVFLLMAGCASTHHAVVEVNGKKVPLQGERIGPADAPVQIVAFIDYQCTYCKQAQSAVKALLRKYPKKVAMINENFPLPTHHHAFRAAVAAECIRRQDPRAFMAYQDSLFANQNRLGFPLYKQLAAGVGIADSTVFNRCLAHQQTAKVVQSGKQLANKLNILGVPAFMINSKLVYGVLSRKRLNRLVKDALAKAEQ